MVLEQIAFVLNRPSSAENVGAVARAMKNFGLSRLAIVASPAWEGLPREGGTGTARDAVLGRARRTARRAADLLERASVHDSARGALAETTWTCGTTSRAPGRRPQILPRELAAELVRRAGSGPVAVLFGEERRGLSDAELDLCQAVCTIPTATEYDSMNLAQAAAVVAYEIALAVQPAITAPAAAEPARHATLEALWERLRQLLLSVGYLNAQNPDHILADWRRLFARAEPSQREAEILLAAVRSLERAVRQAAR